MKIGLKRKLAGLLVMLMMVSVILCDRSALSAHAAGEAIAVDFSDGSVSGNEITYNVGGNTGDIDCVRRRCFGQNSFSPER